jgi:phosphoglycolate phosphatase
MICGNREGVPLKPDTALVDLILEAADVERSKCVMVGDSAVDVQTAKGAGIVSVGVSWGFRSRTELEEAGADYIADSAAQLKAILSAI